MYTIDVKNKLWLLAYVLAEKNILQNSNWTEQKNTIGSQVDHSDDWKSLTFQEVQFSSQEVNGTIKNLLLYLFAKYVTRASNQLGSLSTKTRNRGQQLTWST